VSGRRLRAWGRFCDLRLGCGLAVVVLLLGVVAAGCKPPPPPPPLFTTSPALFPDFNTSVSDYVSRCSSSAPVQVSVNAPQGTTVSVDGQPAQGGTFSAQVTRAVGKSFTVVAQTSSGSSTYYVRCLPADFPTWTTARSGSTQAEYYITVPFTSLFGSNYPTIFDNDGVPIWWAPSRSTVFAELLPDGNVAWTLNAGGAEEHSLDGTLVRSINTVGSSSDFHDLVHLPNGDDLLATNTLVAGVDLSTAWGASSGCPSNATVTDPVIQEVNSQGSVVWSWDTMANIPVTETDPQWRSTICTGASPYDVYHWNSIDPTTEPTTSDPGLILSFRHLDAVYNVDQTLTNPLTLKPGLILWKLGGTTPTNPTESLTIKSDPVFAGGSHFGGQHDPRMLSDGTLTLHDNGTNLGRPPRVVRYQIDATARTATLLESLGDPLVSSSGCCGSARRQSGGDWVVAWGGSHVATELTASGTRVFLLQFDSSNLYRALPIPYGRLDRAALRAAMDTQFASSQAAQAPPPPRGPQQPTAPPRL
jgi:hypothetical protein